jgi:hypothetical protein
MMNTFLANQAYSNKEELAQLQSLERVNAPKDEIALVKEGWRIRRVLAKKGREKLEIALKKEGAKL